MNILFFTYDLPFPLTTGGKIRSYHLLKTLAQKHQVTLVSFYRRDEQLAQLKNLSFLSRIYTLKRRNLYSLSTFPHLFTLPFPIALYHDPLNYKLVKKIREESMFDAIHYESFYTTVFVDPTATVPQIIGTENIEWHVYKQYLEQQPKIIQPLLAGEINRIRAFEEKTWKQASKCIAVSEENKMTIEKVTQKTCEVIANGVDLDIFKFKKPTVKKDLPAQAGKLRFLFVGSMQYIQNKDACQWLTSAIWPKIKEVLKKHGVQGTLSIVGPGTEMLSIADESVECLGEVDDIAHIYHQNDILLAPLRAGSGTKFKVLESAAVGNVVVTTDVGMEGLDGFANYEQLILANNPDEFAQSVDFILTNPEKTVSIAQNARKAVESHHSWEQVGKKLLRYYETVINHNR